MLGGKDKFQNITHFDLFLLMRRINFTIIIYTESVSEILKWPIVRYSHNLDPFMKCYI